MAFPEGKKDWFMILTFVIALIRMIGDHFFQEDSDGKT